VGVSARAAEVLAALAEHLTNAKIGARLFISIRTVECHV
jgi:DNA-binding CsgD family transcriptional regulator